MEEWQKDFSEIVEVVALMVDEFFMGVSELVEVVAEQVQNTIIIADVDQCLQELLEPFIESYSEFEEMGGNVDLSFTYTIDPTPDKHPACIGCHHYHGQVYSGNLLVCAMHPYGRDDDHCPDWEAIGKDYY
jgi:hypothetical protein